MLLGSIMVCLSHKISDTLLGPGTTVPLDDIDWMTSRFPERDQNSPAEPGAMAGPGARNPKSTDRNPPPEPRKRPGMLPTQPKLPTKPEPPKPRGWDREIDM